MKKITLLILCGAVMSFTLDCLAVTKPPLSKMAVCVLDDAGVPVNNAHVNSWTYWKPGGKIHGVTDSKGIFQYKDRVYREIGYMVMKEGYYDSLGTAWWPKKLFEVPETNLVVVLKRMINPVPMIRRSIGMDIPTLDGEVSFDLAVGDWTAPYGNGNISDISFSSLLQFESRDNFKVEVSAMFNNPLCGFQRFSAPQMEDFHKMNSQLMPSQTASLTGYEKALSLWFSYNPEERTRTHEKPDNNYLFRTRVVTNAVGEIVSANYAWTVGDISIDTNGGKRPWIGFTYYYNPDPTSRSLEPKVIADQQARGGGRDGEVMKDAAQRNTIDTRSSPIGY